jgi:hypothetical protein
MEAGQLMHRNVVLIDDYGDTQRGVERFPVRSDEPAAITVGSTEMWLTVWKSRGWSVAWVGEWEE